MRLTKLARRRKTILGAVLGFGAVALLTTGAASYIISISTTSVEDSVGITVDTVKGDFVEIKLAEEETDMSIKLTETDADDYVPANYAVGFSSDADGIQLDPGEVPLEITLPTVTITYGTSWLEGGNELQLNYSLTYDSAHNSNIKNLVSESGDLINKRETGDVNYASANYFTYLVAPASAKIGTGTGDNGVSTLTLSKQKATFGWGSFFGNQSPLEYYNGLFYKANGEGGALDGSDTAGREEIDIDIASNISKELNAMHGALNGNNLTLTISITQVPKA